MQGGIHGWKPASKLKLRRHSCLHSSFAITLSLFFVFISHQIANASCVITQQSEKMTGAACRAFEAGTLHATSSALHATSAATVADSTSRPASFSKLPGFGPMNAAISPLLLPISAPREIASRSNFLRHASTMGHGCFEVFGSGVVFEREQAEAVGTTRALAEAYLSYNGAFLLLDDFIPHPGSAVRRSLSSANRKAGSRDCCSSPIRTAPSPSSRPTAASPPSRRSAKAIQWELSQPNRANGRSRSKTRYGRASMCRLGSAIQIHRDLVPFSGEIPLQLPRTSSWRLDQLTLDGLRFVEQGRAGDSLTIPDSGTYALTWRTQESGVTRIYRQGIHVGFSAPIFYRQSPDGITGEAPEIRCAIFGMNLPASGAVTATVGDASRDGLGLFRAERPRASEPKRSGSPPQRRYVRATSQCHARRQHESGRDRRFAGPIVVRASLKPMRIMPDFEIASHRRAGSRSPGRSSISPTCPGSPSPTCDMAALFNCPQGLLPEGARRP